ncbi:MAG: hypothetical protein KJ018_22260 [Burkholderiales bacterium]|nr:hypothetical protein [Burkholderiales bacterium]
MTHDALVRDGLPVGMLDGIRADWSYRVHPVAAENPAAFGALPVAVALWRPETEFAGRQHVVTEAGQAMVAAAIAAAPYPPTALVDGAHEVVALWALDRPITDERQARDVLTALATRVGAEPVPDGPLTAITLPACGAVRDWTATARERIEIVHLAATRLYSVSQLLETPHVQADPTPADPVTRSGRPGRQSARAGATR